MAVVLPRLLGAVVGFAAIYAALTIFATTASADEMKPIRSPDVDTNEMVARCAAIFLRVARVAGMTDGPEAEEKYNKMTEAWITLSMRYLPIDTKQLLAGTMHATKVYAAERQEGEKRGLVFQDLKQHDDGLFCDEMLGIFMKAAIEAR